MDGQSADPLFSVKWEPQLLRSRTVTSEAKGEDASAAPATPPAPGAKEAASGGKEETLGLVRGLELRAGGTKPLLLYFHWPHEDGDKGKRVVKFCGGPLDEEAFVRVTSLFHCIEINTRDSESALVDEAKVRTTPSLMVCKPDGTILWRTEETGFSGKGLADTLKGVLRQRFPAAWAGIEKEAEAQKAALAEARKAVAEKKMDDARAAIYRVVDSEVRFTDAWADAVKWMREDEKKAAEDAKR